MFDKRLHSIVELNSEKFENKDEGFKVSLEYYLLNNLYEDNEENTKIKTYGIQVVKKEYKDTKITCIENEFADHLSLNRTIVENILDNLSKNYVTPISLHAVVDDLLGVEI